MRNSINFIDNEGLLICEFLLSIALLGKISHTPIDSTYVQWTDPKWVAFYERCKNAIETFDVLVIRVHDIYSNRILNVLMAMQEITLQTLPLG